MKTKELKSIAQKNGMCLVKAKKIDYIYVYSNDKKTCYASISTDMKSYFKLESITPPVVAHAIIDYANTPLRERDDEPIYFVKPMLDSQLVLNVNEIRKVGFLSSRNETPNATTKFTTKELQKLDYLKEINGQWYLKLELEEVEENFTE